MIQVKMIFGQDETNNWLKNNQNIKILNIEPVPTMGGILFTITYEQKEENSFLNPILEAIKVCEKNLKPISVDKKEGNGALIIYSRDLAADMVNKFEDILLKYNVCIPSPEDSERDPEDMLGLYGSTYYGLLDDIESLLNKEFDNISNAAKKSQKIIIKTDVFSGN